MQQQTAYSAVVAYVSPSLPIYILSCFYDPFWVKNDIYRDGDTYDHSLQLHYRQFLVVADLPSLSPFIS